MQRALVALFSLCAGALLTPMRARAWEPFRSESDEVREGNEHLQKGQLAEALKAYGEAAKRLPNEPGVHLDRGIALLKSGKPAEAREALRLATQGNAPAEIRSPAHYNLGLAFMREADELAKQEDLEGAQKLLRESADSFKSALRAGPKNRDAAWNLELAKRRIVELEKKEQEKKQQEKQEQEKKEQENKEEEKKKEDEQSENKDEQNDEQKKEQDEQAKQDGKSDDEGEKDEKKKQDDSQDGGAQPQDAQDAGTPPPEQESPQDSSDQNAAPEPALPEHMQKALDALEDSEENLQKHRAATRARQRPRRIEKDW